MSQQMTLYFAIRAMRQLVPPGTYFSFHWQYIQYHSGPAIGYTAYTELGGGISATEDTIEAVVAAMTEKIHAAQISRAANEMASIASEVEALAARESAGNGGDHDH
jgi:hypothetical protein